MNVWDKNDLTKAKDYKKKHSLTYLILMDKDEGTFKAYMKPKDPQGVPTNCVVDRKGKITYLQAGYSEADVLKAVEKALK